MNPMVNIAILAVRKAGKFIIKIYESYHNNILYYNDNIFNIIDYELKNIIIKVINKFYPYHFINFNKLHLLNKKNINKEIEWIIFPLDGKQNFFNKFPHFSISIAVRIKNKIIISIIYDPIKNELFSAIDGQGAKLDDYRLRIKKKNNNIKQNIIALGPIYDNFNKNKNININLYNKLLLSFYDFRRTGSILLDLAYIAAGRIDGLIYFYQNNSMEYYNGLLFIFESGNYIKYIYKNKNNNIFKIIIIGNLNIIQYIKNIIN